MTSPLQNSNPDAEEIYARIALSATFPGEPRVQRALVDSLGSALAAFNLKPQDIPDSFSEDARGRILSLDSQSLERAMRTYDALPSFGACYISDTSPYYPSQLRVCDAPLGLFVRSSSPIQDVFAFGAESALSVVGTRGATSYGLSVCRQMIGEVAVAAPDMHIISGLAAGIDLKAHLSAFEYNLPTIAVIAPGIDSIYPAYHEKYVEKFLSAAPSAIVSENPPGAAVYNWSFLMRNRIVAALSGATLVVESPLKGGSMSTAHLAFGYDRSVLAVPGRVDDARSAGCNSLVAKGIATLIDCPGTLLSTLGLGQKGSKKKRLPLGDIIARHYNGKGEDVALLQSVVKLISNHRDIVEEEIAEALGVPIQSVLPALSVLEADGFIQIDLLGRCCIAI